MKTFLRKGRFNVRIADSGIGMTADELERVFAAFAQGDHSKECSHRCGGLGLEMAISKKLVELHSGRISADSKGRDQGAIFEVEFPLMES